MEYGPDGYPVSSKSIIVGPPLQGPAPVPATITETVLEPPKYENVVVQSAASRSSSLYSVAVYDGGSKITDRVTVLNFVGANVTATNNGNIVTIIVDEISSYNFIAGPGIDIDVTNGNVTITNTLPDYVFTAGNGISIDNTANNVTITNALIDTVFDGGSVTGNLVPDLNNGTIQKFTLTGNITLDPPTNMGAGKSLTLILTQDSAGNRLLNPNTAYLFASGFETLSTNSGAIDMLNIFTDGTTYYTTLTVDYS